MTVPRIYQPIPLSNESEITLDEFGTQHLKALRLMINDPIVIFNGNGLNFHGKITSINQKTIHVKLMHHEKSTMESSLTIHIWQAVSRSERMDYTIQKTTELGVNTITPILSNRCEVHLSTERWQKRQQHWQRIAISACEQCGRSQIPTIHFPILLGEALTNIKKELAWILDSEAAETLIDLEPCFIKKPPNITILIGPEGGLTQAEISLAKQYLFTGIRLGKRILRTETAGVAVLAAIHARWGDFL